MSIDSLESRAERYVLCVDDDPGFLETVEFFLPERIRRASDPGLHYHFLFLNDPLVALTSIEDLIRQGASIAMVISDEKMPGMRGMELLACARDLSPDSIRVLLTVHAGIQPAIQAINERLLDLYLMKPIENEHEFSLGIQQQLERFELQGRLESRNKIVHELLEFANTVHAMDTMDGTLDYVAAFTRRVMQCRHVCILSNADGLRPNPSGASSSDLPVCSDWSFPGGAEARRLLESSRAAVSPSLAAVPGARLDESSQVAPFAGPVAYVPLTSGRFCLGFLCAGGRNETGAFTGSDVDALTCIGSSASIALQNQLNRELLNEAYAESKTYAIDLARSNTRLQMLDRLKNDCLAFIFHELRTPLNYKYAMQMLDRCKDTAERTRLTGMIREGYERLEQFIGKGMEYLNWFSEPALEPAATDAAALTRAVTAAFKASSPAADVELTVPEAPCLARISSDSLEESIRILLERAVTTSGHDPWVRIVVTARPNQVTLTVTDRGQGFPPEQVAELFRPFVITDSRPAGPILSLAKVAAMVEAHGGTIEGHSPGIGNGATFTIALPVAREGRSSGAAPDRASDLERPDRDRHAA